jgi:peptidyl-prolyl cis-trans isomerase B (cyclophilin B)
VLGTAREETQVAGKDRKRQLARQRYERQRARQAAQERQARRVKVVGGIVVAVLVLGGAGVAFAMANSGDSKATAASAAPAAKPNGDCAYTPAQDSGASKGLGTPPVKPAYKGTVPATIATNLGDIQVNLDATKAPCTVNSFGYLASKKYFDNTQCHRLTTGQGLQVLQCGDPTGTGSGGPGYKFADENLPSGTGAYKVGTVAMANAGPGTNGSQFFIIYGDSSGLGPQYTPFGTVTKGLDIVQDVAKAGSPNGDGKPNKQVVINSFTITK